MDVKAKQTTLLMFSNGIYVITARNGDHFGAATVTWVSQVSFKPPLIMAAIRPGSNVFKCLSASGFAAIHVLASTQQDIAQKFFYATDARTGRINDEPFADGKTCAPILTNLPAYVECRVREILSGGDHAVVILEVVEAACRELVCPLTIGESPWRYGG
jgi:flavin reductase (DIM6/NTAB) family NADH-FMN oxidoreductase RutF